MNKEVLSLGGGLPATTVDEWEEAIRTLLESGTAAEDMGRQGRRAAEEHYSLRALAPRLAGFLREVQ
jgi:hypothetical protein